MKLFSPADRQKVLEMIISITGASEHIVSLVMVGSGAFGYNDEFSDLDFVIALDDDANMECVMAYVSAELHKRLNIIYFNQNPSRRLQVYLADHFLEIDIGYGGYVHAAAFKPHWKVLFDKSGTVEWAMRLSWERIQNTPKTDAYQNKIADCGDGVWHHFMHAAVAIKRGQFWRAFSELELIRNAYIELLGARYDLETKRGRELDKLPEAQLEILQKTLVQKPEADELKRSLAKLIDAVYTEMETYGEKASIAVSRKQMAEYIKALSFMPTGLVL